MYFRDNEKETISALCLHTHFNGTEQEAPDHSSVWKFERLLNHHNIPLNDNYDLITTLKAEIHFILYMYRCYSHPRNIYQ